MCPPRRQAVPPPATEIVGKKMSPEALKAHLEREQFKKEWADFQRFLNH